ncbi:MAG: heavy metal-binding domain-containing protein [Acidimicrobiales bacterium]
MSTTSDVPEAAPRRLESGSFSSGLTVPDFAACLQMGLRPVGLVQGFCAMQWGFYGVGSPYMRGISPYAQTGGGHAYTQNWYCPHGIVSAEHRQWGQNYEQPWVEQAWLQGFNSAFSRLIDEAKEVGAHGVIGVTDTSHNLVDMNAMEFHVLGTAVVVEGAPPPPKGEPWSTYLAGQRLAKLIEAGFMPISVVATMASVRVWAYCVTEYLMEGRGYLFGQGGAVSDVEQVSQGLLASRSLARDRVRRQLAGDTLHGAAISNRDREIGSGDLALESYLRGTRVRRFKDFDPMAAPRPTVRLS